MYSILVSLDEGLAQILKQEHINLEFILKFRLLKEEEQEIRYFHTEIKKNIRLNIESRFFFLLNSICLQKHSYLNEYAGELILEAFLDIIRHEQR